MNEQNENNQGNDGNNEGNSKFSGNRADIDQNKMFAALAYIVFFIPLLACNDSPFGRYHANQGLVLLIAAAIIRVVGSIIPFIGWFIILPLGGIFIFVLMIIGFMNAIRGDCKPLPVIGSIKLI